MAYFRAALRGTVEFIGAALIVGVILAFMLRLLNGSTRPEDVKAIVLTQQDQLARLIEITSRIDGQVSAGQGWRKMVSDDLSVARNERLELRDLVQRICGRKEKGK